MNDARVQRDTEPVIVKPRNSIGFPFLALAGLTGVYLLSVLISPDGSPDGRYFTICVFKNLTGLPCPGCGLTHSFCAMGKGDAVTAIQFNLFGPGLYVAGLAAWLWSLARLAGWHRIVGTLESFASRSKIVNFAVIGFIVFGLARMTYLVASRPSILGESPLMRLLSQVIG